MDDWRYDFDWDPRTVCYGGGDNETGECKKLRQKNNNKTIDGIGWRFDLSGRLGGIFGEDVNADVVLLFDPLQFEIFLSPGATVIGSGIGGAWTTGLIFVYDTDDILDLAEFSDTTGGTVTIPIPVPGGVFPITGEGEYSQSRSNNSHTLYLGGGFGGLEWGTQHNKNLSIPIYRFIPWVKDFLNIED